VEGEAASFPEVASAGDIQEGDIVFFAKSSPGTAFMRISCCANKDYDVYRGEWYCTIGNKDGHENGWAYMETIYDRLVYAGA